MQANSARKPVFITASRRKFRTQNFRNYVISIHATDSVLHMVARGPKAISRRAIFLKKLYGSVQPVDLNRHKAGDIGVPQGTQGPSPGPLLGAPPCAADSEMFYCE